MRILFFLNRKKTNKRGEAPIYCRITIRGQRSEFSTGIFTHHSFWNPDTHTIMNADDPNTELYNTQLSNLTADIRMIKMNLEQQGPATPDMIRSMLKQSSTPQIPDITIEDLLILFIAEKTKEVSAGFTLTSLRHYTSKLKHIQEFTEQSYHRKYLAKSVTVDYGNNFVLWMRTRGYHQNSIYKILQVFSQAMKFAVMRQLIEKNDIPFVRLKLILPDKIETITENQRNSLQSYIFQNTRVAEAQDLFLLQCWTGVEYADLERLNDRNNYYERNGRTWLDFTRHKTGVRAMLPLFPKAKEILERHSYNIHIQPNAPYNDNLKVIAAIMGWSINLVSNTGRKSFGQHRVNEGYSLDAVARMMGHTTSKTTQTYYARVGVERLQQEITQLDIDYTLMVPEIAKEVHMN